MDERKGAAYSIKAKMAVQDPGGNSQSPHHTKTIPSRSTYGPMEIRRREYDDARSGKMSEEQMRRVDINPAKVRPSGVTGAGMPAHDRP
jgi:hypothetical protein